MLRSLFSRPREPDAIELHHEGERFGVRICRSARARRFTLRLNAAKREAVLTLPARARLSEAMDFAQRNAAWVAVRLARLPVDQPFVAGADVPLRGIPHRIVHRPDRRGTVWVETGEHGPELHVAGDPAFLSRRVLDFLKKQARADLTNATRIHAAAIGRTVTRISLKDTRSRWGSCSTTGTISYSWRVILAPPEVLDYLVAHEVAHLVEMNHSPRFWAVVARLCPNMQKHRHWLKQNGASLHRYG